MAANAPDLQLIAGGKPERLSDGELVLRARSGDRTAAHELYERSADMVNGLAFRLLGGDRDLDDLVQDVYVRAFSRLDDLDDPQCFSSWICTILVRRVQRHFAKRKRRRVLGLADRHEIDPEVIVGPSTPPEVAIEMRRVYGLLSQLPEEQQLVLLLKRVEGYSVAAIAAKTGQSDSTVKRRLAAAESALRGIQHG